MEYKAYKLKELLKESKIESKFPDVNKRIRVKLNVLGVEKRPVENEVSGATKQFLRKAGQFIYGKQNLHKGAFGIVPNELDGYETSSDIPSFDVDNDLVLTEFIYYFFKGGNRYLSLESMAKGVGSKRIQPKELLELEINIPPKYVQERLIKNLQSLELSGAEISTEITHQLDLIKDLRQAFLREAMQGKLVSNETYDGKTGADLLQEIQTEKEKLIKEKKIKKSKPLPPISKEEIPFEIPENWVWCRLDQLCENIIDCPHSTPKYTDEDFGFYGIDTNCISSNGTLIKLRNLKEESYLERVKRLIPKEGDIIYSREGTIGLCYELNEKNVCLGQRVMLFRINNKLVRNFIKKNIISDNFKKLLLKKHRGMGAKHINVGDIVSALIPLPPMEVQDRIILTLDKLMNYCDELEKSVKESQNYNEQLLQQVLRESLEGKNEVENENLQLVAEESSIYSISKDIQKNCDTGDMTILAGYIIKKLSTQNSKDFGRVKLQKMLHLVEYHCQLSSELKYQKNVAGPHAWELEHLIEPKLKSLRFFEIKKDKFGTTSKVTYTPLSASNELTSLFNREFKDQAESINNLLDKFQSKTWEFCEMISTVYAVWNNRLIRKELFTDEILKQDFLAWDDKKKRFIDQLDYALEWIRKEKIEPVGFGDYIDKK